MGAGVSQPSGLGGEAEHGLHHREGDQFGIGELRRDPHGRAPGCQARAFIQQVVGRRIECRREGVQVVRYETILYAVVLAPASTPSN